MNNERSSVLSRDSWLVGHFIVLDILGNHTGAIAYYDKVLAVDPENVFALYDKGLVLNALGNHTGAIQYYDKAFAVDPKNVRALTDKGGFLNDLGNHTGAK